MKPFRANMTRIFWVRTRDCIQNTASRGTRKGGGRKRGRSEQKGRHEEKESGATHRVRCGGKRASTSAYRFDRLLLLFEQTFVPRYHRTRIITPRSLFARLSVRPPLPVHLFLASLSLSLLRRILRLRLCPFTSS